MNEEQIITINLDVDLNNTVTLPRYTSGKSFLFYIDNYTIPEGATVRVFVKKPSGHEVLYTCPFTENRITAPCTLQMTAEVGTANGQVQIFQNGSYLYSFVWTLQVTDNPYAAMQIESSDEYRTLEELIQGAEYILTTVQQQEADRVTAENARASAETARASAESSRRSAETSRANAESGRVSAESGRVSAENSRVSAESARASAETARANAENARAAAENARASTYSNWNTNLGTLLDNYNSLVDQIEGMSNPDDKYVRLNTDWITRGSCTMQYSQAEGGLVISFS